MLVFLGVFGFFCVSMFLFGFDVGVCGWGHHQVGCGCVIVTCRLTMVRNATSPRALDLTRSSYVHFCDSDQQSVHRFSQEFFQRRSHGFPRVTMPRLCPPILTRTGKHTLLRHYLRVRTFHRSIVIDLYRVTLRRIANSAMQNRRYLGGCLCIWDRV